MVTISEDQIRLMARLAVLEQTVAHLYAMNIRIMRRLTDEPKRIDKAAKKQFKEMRRLMRVKTFPDLDPAMSDLWAAELESRLDHILLGVEEMLGKDESAKSR